MIARVTLPVTQYGSQLLIAILCTVRYLVDRGEQYLPVLSIHACFLVHTYTLFYQVRINEPVYAQEYNTLDYRAHFLRNRREACI